MVQFLFRDRILDLTYGFDSMHEATWHNSCFWIGRPNTPCLGHCRREMPSHFDWPLGGERVVSSGNDFTVKVWNVHTEECLHTLTGHTKMINSLLFEPERDLVVSGSRDGTIRVWDVRRGIGMHRTSCLSSRVRVHGLLWDAASRKHFGLLLRLGRLDLGHS
ncbi:unnamed protein product, partial [Mesorhabditis belari]|uniref:Uncharacterized protein n=1 Tax=Mesorhabditis belari TaxID=2138241 RepID=A0AAF3EZ12_9BILA